MNIRLVLGENNSGKSLYAEQLAVESGAPRYYFATMVPQTDENHLRIEKHRIQRADKGFITVEEPWNIADVEVEKDAVVLLEDASNLLANGIFQYHKDGLDTLDQILSLSRKCKTLIVVSIADLVDEGYDEGTVHYIHELNWLNEQLRMLAEYVYVMCDGVPVIERRPL